MGPDEWNPQGGNYGGNGYHNGPMYGGRDRGPAGPPRPRYDDRRGPPPPDASRQGPQWRQDRRPPPPTNGHGLPPPSAHLPRRPDVVMPPNRGPPLPPSIAAGGARGGGAPNVDTYIPSYNSRPNDGSDRGRRGSRDSYRDPDAAPPSSRYRDDPPRGGYRDMGTEGLAHTGTTTTTMTPVGFPLARYSHHAPREGRSLSTAGSASN